MIKHHEYLLAKLKAGVIHNTRRKVFQEFKTCCHRRDTRINIICLLDSIWKCAIYGRKSKFIPMGEPHPIYTIKGLLPRPKKSTLVIHESEYLKMVEYIVKNDALNIKCSGLTVHEDVFNGVVRTDIKIYEFKFKKAK